MENPLFLRIVPLKPPFTVIIIPCEAPKIAKLVNITPRTMVYGTYNYGLWNLNQLITGGHHIVGDVLLPGHYVLDPRGSKRQASMPPVRQSQHSYIRATLPEQRATGVGAIKQGQHQWLKNMYILGG